MLWGRCPICLSYPVCLSVTLVYCGQTAGRIKMPLGMEVNLDLGDVVLDRDPAPPPRKGWHSSPEFLGHILWPNGWMDQDATWYGGRPRLCPFRGGGAGCPSNTMWPGPRPTSTPSFILIHPAVWPQYTNVTDRTGQDRQTDNGPIA